MTTSNQKNNRIFRQIEHKKKNSKDDRNSY